MIIRDNNHHNFNNDNNNDSKHNNDIDISNSNNDDNKNVFIIITKSGKSNICNDKMHRKGDSVSPWQTSACHPAVEFFPFS